MLANRMARTLDTLTILKDAGLVASSAAAQVGGAAKVVDLGGSSANTAATPGMDQARMYGEVEIDMSAVEVGTGDELFTLILEGCNTADFSTGSPQIEPLAMMAVGAGAVIPGAGATSTPTGRIIMPFTNWKNGLTFRYVRMYTLVVGTIATGINYTAALTKCG